MNAGSEQLSVRNDISMFVEHRSSFRVERGKMALTEFLESIPENKFWVDDFGEKPDYKGLLLEALTCQMGPDVKLSELHRDLIPNPSSFQRAVAKEARSRRLGRGF